MLGSFSTKCFQPQAKPLKQLDVQKRSKEQARVRSSNAEAPLNLHETLWHYSPSMLALKWLCSPCRRIKTCKPTGTQTCTCTHRCQPASLHGCVFMASHAGHVKHSLCTVMMPSGSRETASCSFCLPLLGLWHASGNTQNWEYVVCDHVQG